MKGLARIAVVALWLTLLQRTFNWPEWPYYAILAWIPYQVVGSAHALRWFASGRKTAWSRTAALAQP